MAMYKRYQGEFLSVSGVTWRAEIWQEADRAFSSVGALEFDADEPLTIEWSRKAKEEVLCGSSATLKIISPDDRTYEDLYTIAVGSVRLDVYRDGQLYWSGSIDTEFYEEPYEQFKGYDVTLTFTDFGVLDRLKFDLTGMHTIRDIVDYAINRAGINSGGIDDSVISTSIDESTTMSLNDVKVWSANFYDEDGEALTISEVLTGILQPLALKMVQRRGEVHIYDINALYNKARLDPIEWDGSSQTMSVDNVYNNAKITWSPYVQGKDLLPDVCWPDDIKTPAYLTAVNELDGVKLGDATYYSYHYATDIAEWDPSGSGFTLWTSSRGEGATLLQSSARFFRIVPQYDGTEAEGIALKWTAVEGYKFVITDQVYADYNCVRYGGSVKGSYPSAGSSVFRSSDVWLPPVENPSSLLIRLNIEMLLDVRSNPFESAANLWVNSADGKEKTSSEQLREYGNFIYMPVHVYYQPDGSSDVYVWTNINIVSASVDNPMDSLPKTLGEWVKSDTHGYLGYYADDRKNDSGAMGWQKNRPAINPHTKDLGSSLAKADGQYIPYPLSGGGKMWVAVDSGWLIIDNGEDLADATNGEKSLHDRIKWALLKMPQIEIVNNRQFAQEIENEDVEYSAELNTLAKESIELSTICGTSVDGMPTARGAYYSAASNFPINNFTRAGRTSQVEDLLIGTLYSQYAERRTILSGESVILAEPIAKYSEANQGDKLFMVVEDLQNLRADTSEATYIEIRPDEYKRNNE